MRYKSLFYKYLRTINMPRIFFIKKKSIFYIIFL